MTVIVGTEQDDWLGGDAGDDVIGGLGGDDYLFGNAGDDLLIGNRGDDWLFGGDGDDDLYGYTILFSDPDDPLGGNDTLDGGAGYDTLTGGFGDDVYRLGDVSILGGGPWTPYYWAFDEVIEDAGKGRDTVEVASYNGFKSSYVLPDNVENGLVLGDQNFTLLGNGSLNVLTGGAGADRLLGQAGDDQLNGGDGYDTLEGGVGNDLYVLRDVTVIGSSPLRLSFDAVIEGAGAGFDTVHISGNSGLLSGYTLPDNVENGVVISAGAFRLWGNAADNQLVGNNGADTLDGRDGNDMLTAGGGQDTLTGGSGADRFRFDAASDSIVGATSDLVTDFSHAQGDIIALSTIDANQAAAGNQAFTFIGTGLYTGVAGQLRYAVKGGVTTIAGDVDGDRVSDFHIRLTGTITLVAGDFTL